MYHTCLHCTRDLGTNDSVETLPIGRRVAFDASRGRLWVICRSCGKWNLVPFDNRLEAIDDCARLFHDTRTRFSTDNIGLARMPDGLELVRIGEPQRPEFASWRYGAQYKRRRRMNMAIGAGALAITSTVNLGLVDLVRTSSFLVDVPMMMGVTLGVTFAGTRLRDQRQRVVTTIPSTSGVAKIGHDTALSTHLAYADGEMKVSWSPGIIAAFRKQTASVSGPDARLLVRRLLGLVNRNVGSAKQLTGAVGRVETGGMDRWLRTLGSESVDFLKVGYLQRLRVSGAMFLPWISYPDKPVRSPGFEPGSFQLASLSRPDRLAIEMWLSEEDEARALAGELALLERQWREAEELAAIADGLALMTPAR